MIIFSSPELNEDEIALASETISKAGSDDIKAEIMDENCDGDHGVNSNNGSPSDEQVRASMIHLLNPVLGSAFGVCRKTILIKRQLPYMTEFLTMK